MAYYALFGAFGSFFYINITSIIIIKENYYSQPYGFYCYRNTFRRP